MDSRSLSQEQRRVEGRVASATANPFAQMVGSLEAQRSELELQNRALQDTQGELAFAVQRYADLYDHLPIGYVTLVDGDKIEEANLTAATWLGVERAQLLGAHMSRFLNPFDAGRFAIHLDLCLHSRTEKIFEATLRANSGEMMPVQFSSRVAETHGGGRKVLSAITNVAQLKQSQQLMSEIRREHDALGDSISHDLRSPLVTIGTYAKIVLSEHGNSLHPEVRGMVERIDRAAQRMEATLRQLLAYSTLVHEEAGPERVETEEIVQTALKEFRGQIEASGATVEIMKPLPAVRACPKLLLPALTNVISNALKFTAPGEKPHLTITAEQQGEFIVLTFADRGIGIDPQHHERIFAVFDRLHGYSIYPGSGVGLAIVRRALDRMHGRVWVESARGKGSRFHLMLPKA